MSSHQSVWPLTSGRGVQRLRVDPVSKFEDFIQDFTDTHAKDSSYILLPPKRELEIDSRLRGKLAAALVTRYSPNNLQMKISIATASRHVPARVHQWGQAQIHGGGDRFKCRALLKDQKCVRDCTYVKVSAPDLLSCHVYPTNYKTISTKPRLTFMRDKSTGHR